MFLLGEDRGDPFLELVSVKVPSYTMWCSLLAFRVVVLGSDVANVRLVVEAAGVRSEPCGCKLIVPERSMLQRLLDAVAIVGVLFHKRLHLYR